ncbi:MAG: hypothetical protein HYY18_00735 [Planctomycetes bacterium]|nr:hypothetical protein [Planctomycetota bacterium]
MPDLTIRDAALVDAPAAPRRLPSAGRPARFGLFESAVFGFMLSCAGVHAVLVAGALGPPVTWVVAMTAAAVSALVFLGWIELPGGKLAGGTAISFAVAGAILVAAGMPTLATDPGGRESRRRECEERVRSLARRAQVDARVTGCGLPLTLRDVDPALDGRCPGGHPYEWNTSGPDGVVSCPTHGFRAGAHAPRGADRGGRLKSTRESCRERLAALVAALQATARNAGGCMPASVDPQAPFLKGLTDCPHGGAYAFEPAGGVGWVFCESHGLTGRACLEEEPR